MPVFLILFEDQMGFERVGSEP